MAGEQSKERALARALRPADEIAAAADELLEVARAQELGVEVRLTLGVDLPEVKGLEPGVLIYHGASLMPHAGGPRCMW
jgi:hypothetical protein